MHESIFSALWGQLTSLKSKIFLHCCIVNLLVYLLPLPILVYKLSTFMEHQGFFCSNYAVTKLCPTSRQPFLCLFQPDFILEGSLEILDHGQNARFGSTLAPVPDLNGDSFNDVVIGAPLEDDNKGAIYIYHSQHNRILRKYKQVPHKCPATVLCLN